MKEGIYNLIAKRIINNNDNKQELLFDQNFIFSSSNKNRKNLSVKAVLTEGEINNKKLGIYNDNTKKLQELEYIYYIINNLQIKPFKTIEEREIFLNAIQKIKQYSKTNMLSNIKQSLIAIIKEMPDAFGFIQGMCSILGTIGIVSVLQLSVNPLYLLVPFTIISVPLSIFTGVGYNMEKEAGHFYRIENKKRATEAIENIDSLSKKIELLPSKETILIEEKTDLKCEKNIQDPVLNEISNLVELLSNSTLDNLTLQNYLSKIKSIKDGYTSRLSQINELSVDNEYTIQGYFIQEIAKLEYEINASIIQNKENIQNQTESKLIDAKIHSLQQRTKNR